MPSRLIVAGKDTYAHCKMQGYTEIQRIDFPTPLSYLHLMSQAAYKTGGIAIADAYAHCKALTCAHYENFPVGSVLIPKSVRPHVYSIYAFARTADDFADEPGMTVQERLDSLAEWEARLDACLSDPVGPIFTALAETIRVHDLPVQLLKDLLAAFRMDVTTHRHQTYRDLLTYCTFSANPVGRLILHLFGYRGERYARHSDAICSALQLANFWQDIAIDFSRGRIYLPQEDLKRFGVGISDLGEQRVTPQFCKLMDYLINRTRDLFLQGSPLLDMVSGRLRFELRLTYLGGMHILKKIRDNNCDIFHRRPTVTKRDLPALLFKTLFFKGFRS